MPASLGVAKDTSSIFSPQAAGLGYGIYSSPKTRAHNSNSGLLTVGIIISDVVGGGLLALPSAVAHLGWVGGSVLMVVLLFLNVHTTILMWRVYMSCPGATTYSSLVELAFADAPASQRDFVVPFTKVTQVITMGGFLGLYLLNATKALALLRYDLEICFPIWALGVCCLLLPLLASMRRLGTWKWPIFANAGSMIIVLCVSLFVLERDLKESVGIEPSHRAVAVNSHMHLRDVIFSACSCACAFSGQMMIVEIVAEMRDPAEFPRYCIFFAVPYQLLVFLVAGVGGYLCLGDRVHGILLDYLPFGFALKVAALCLLVNMVVGFCIKAVVTGRVMHRALGGEEVLTEDSHTAAMTWRLIATCLVAAAYLLSQVVPFFTELVDLMGACFVPVLCYGLPVAMYARWLRDHGSEADMPGTLEKMLMGFEVALTVGFTLVGTYYVVTRINEQWHLYGMPFDCHCEYIWKTCACSSGRPGMDSTCGSDMAMVTEPARQIAGPLFSSG